MSESPEPLACEVISYTDEQLNQYLEKTRRLVSVQDPENLTTEFIQRLKDLGSREQETTQSRPVDLDQVTSRLQELSDDHKSVQKPRSLASTPLAPTEEEYDEICRARETEAYHALVKECGRQPYPFDLLEDILFNPEKHLKHDVYGGLVSFWRAPIHEMTERVCICQSQLWTWKTFRKVQQMIRERNLRDEWTLIQASVWDSWEVFTERHGPREGDWGFTEYEMSLKTRLAKFGFTRPFKLERDFSQQTLLTTWIEYLGYEYLFYDDAATFVVCSQKHHDDAWKKVVEARVLRPDESCTSVRDMESILQDAHEHKTAKKAVETAVKFVEVFNMMKGYHPKSEPVNTKLSEAVIALRVAEEKLEVFKKRKSLLTAFIHGTRGYYENKRRVNRYQHIVRWVERQIASIVLEQSSHDVVEGDTVTADSAKRLKRGRSDGTHAADLDLDRSHEKAKRRKPNQLEDQQPSRQHESDKNDVAGDVPCDPSDRATLRQAPDIKRGSKVKGDRPTCGTPLTTYPPLRRSARIAAKTKVPSCTVASSKTPLPKTLKNSTTKPAIRATRKRNK